MYPKTFASLVDSLSRLGGVGLKTAERYAFEIIEWKQAQIDELSSVLEHIASDIQYCSKCGNLAEGELCDICLDGARDQHTICVVQSAKDIVAMEKTQEYRGVYHVLHGVISTSKGILPEDIQIASLLPRVDEHCKEVILATNPTIEGETTAMYLSKLLNKSGVSITRIAHGLPMGGHLDYADELTLIKAMEGRKKM